jgi:hypothetical protein
VAIVVGGVALAVPRFIGDEPTPPMAPPLPIATPAPPPAAAPPPPPAPRMIKARVTSAPPRAEVWWESVKKGETPVELELPAGDDQIELTLKLPGHNDAKAKFYPTSDQDFMVTLTRTKPPKRSGKRPDKKPGGGPTSAGEIKPSPFPK